MATRGPSEAWAQADPMAQAIIRHWAYGPEEPTEDEVERILRGYIQYLRLSGWIHNPGSKYKRPDPPDERRTATGRNR